MKPLLGISLGIALVVGTFGFIGDRGSIAQDPQKIAQLTRVIGKVEVKSHGRRSSTWQPAQEGDFLMYGDLLRVQRNAIAEIQCTTNASIRRKVPNDGIPWGIASVCLPSPSAR
jgi:hypothetical protein